MTVWHEIKKIKDVAKAQRVWEALNSSYTQKVGEKAANHHDLMWQDYPRYKVDGLAWWKDRCLSVANRIIDNASIKSSFAPPTQETLEWGGFLGGEHLTWTDQAERADMEEMVISRIAGL